MIVACERCQTRFQLDDARVPDEGIRVRCSRCKHAFVVAKPGARDDDRTHAIAHGAAARHGDPTPAPTEDLTVTTGRGGTNGDTTGATRPFGERIGRGRDAPGPAHAGAAGARETDDESDWQFNDESPPGRGPREERAAAARPPLAPASRAPEPSLEDLGSPDSWDFLASDDASPPAAAAQDAPAPTSAGPAPAATRRAASTAPAGRRAPARPAAERGGAHSAVPVLARPWRIALWGACAVLLGLVAALSLAPRRTAEIALPAALPAGTFVFDGIRAQRLENAVAGPVFVVRGRLRNDGPEPASLGATLEVTLIGDSGETVSRAAGAAGRALRDEDVRERDPAGLHAELASSADALAWSPLGPGEEVELQAVVEDVPIGARGMAVRLRAVEPPPPPPPVGVSEPEPPPPPPPPVRPGGAKRARG